MARATVVVPRSLVWLMLYAAPSSCSLVIGDLPDPIGGAAHPTTSGAGDAGDETAPPHTAGSSNAPGTGGVGRGAASGMGGTTSTSGAGHTSGGPSGGSRAGGPSDVGESGTNAAAAAGEAADGASGGSVDSAGGTVGAHGGTTGGNNDGARGGVGGTGGMASGATGGAELSGSGGVGNGGTSAGKGGSSPSAGAGGASAGGGNGPSGGTSGNSGGMGGSVPVCDADHDGALAQSGACGGDDCDDTDSNAHPGQQSFFDVPREAGGFDYDCNGNSDREFSTAIDCSALEVGACEKEGFLGSLPSCGQSGTWVRCGTALSPLPLLCTTAEQSSRTMSCR